MKDFNKDNFNDSIRNKFANAEVQPGNNVWEGIEAELLKQDNRIMQKKAAFYRNVAAAVILIAMVSIYFNLQDFTFSTNQSNAFAPIELEEQKDQIFISENNDVLTKPKSLSTADGDNTIFENGNENTTLALLGNVTNQEKNTTIITDNQKRDVIASLDGPSAILISKLKGKTPSDFELPQLEMEVKGVSYFAVSNLEKPKEKSELAWNTNVNVGSGSFNPNSEITSSPINSTVSTLNSPGTAGRTTGETVDAYSQEREAVQELSSAPMRSNVSFTIGLHAGIVLNDRWNIKSGLQFGNYRSSSTSGTVMRDRNSDMLYPFHGASSSTAISDGRVFNVTSEYDIYNDFQILSIPLMASYKIIDRKLDIALVGGATADFILKNTLRGGSDQINDVSFDQNDKQSYKSIFASGIAGIEFSYPLADKYALSIMPTYKRALTNVTTEKATFNSMPAFMGLNMSLAYLF
ncbi:outer membrane beta-barrel protein [Marivirga salinae]|uniref:Outer membrane beta-barrel protein n=1 Tax=Marivirga salinarum TaxID=3059078 RepID=A0AA51NBY6_9BACT|nr:outer membrane beta-barrel protein [Marivirga sp. BDSF4-3]WMN12606.1 outer membrane beta-barrel protein [Marivirga sp. BDSF4-3]